MNRQKGVTLIELMIVIAIVAIIGAIAIPAYNGYIREAKFSTAMHNMETLRVFLEDWNLENGHYWTQAADPLTGVQTLVWPDNGSNDTPEEAFGWRPDGDKEGYTYTLTLTGSTHATTPNTYHISVQDQVDTSVWVRCESRFTTCCDSDTGTAITGC